MCEWERHRRAVDGNVVVEIPFEVVDAKHMQAVAVKSDIERVELQEVVVDRSASIDVVDIDVAVGADQHHAGDLSDEFALMHLEVAPL